MEKRQNKALAILLLSLVILVGAVAWGVIYSYGWFVAIIAFITSYVAILVYDKFYDVNNTVYIITGVAVVIANIIASFLAIGIAVANEANVSLSVAFNAVFESFDLIAKDLAIDCILCIALTVAGLIGVKRTYEQRKAKTTTVMPDSNTTTEVNTDTTDTNTDLDTNNETKTTSSSEDEENVQ